MALLAAGLAGPAVGVVTERTAGRYEQRRIDSLFEAHVVEMAADLQGEYLACVEHLYSLRSIFEASERVEQDEFATLARSIVSRHPMIQAIEWAPRVDERSRASFEAGGVPGFRIATLSTEDLREQGAQASEHYPVAYVEPMLGNEDALGLDLASEQARRDTIAHSVATGALTLSAPIELVQRESGTPGALAILVVRGNRVSPAAPVHPLPAGVVLLVFSYEDLLNAVLTARGWHSSAPLVARLIDATADGQQSVLWSDTSHLSDESEPTWSSAKELELSGQRWSLQAYPTAAFAERHRSRFPLLLGVAAMLATTLLCGGLVTIGTISRSRAMLEKDKLLSLVVNSLSEGVVVADRQGRVTFVNSVGRAFLGPALEDTVDDLVRSWGHRGADGVSLLGPAEHPLARASRGELVSSELVYVETTEVSDGRWFRVSGSPTLDKTGGMVGGVAVFRDVTSDRESKAHVRRLSSAVEQTADQIFITDQAGRILYVNPAFEKTTGYRSEEMLGETPGILKSGRHGRPYYEELWSTILSGEVFRSCTINRKKSGELYHAEQTITPMRNDEGEVSHFVAVCKDMTDRRMREQHELELQLAASVQSRLNPKAPPVIPGVEIGVECHSASAACGDYYDVITRPDGSSCIAIADVCGHGLAPAMIMVATRAYLRSLLNTRLELDEVMTRLNTLLIGDLDDEYFVTMLLVCIAPGTGLVRFVNAGHPAGYVLDIHGRCRQEMPNTGMALGFHADVLFECPEPFHLAPGELVVLFTDGISEARAPDGSLFGEHRIIEAVSAHRSASIPGAIQRLRKSLEQFVDHALPEDDQTVILCRAQMLDH